MKVLLHLPTGGIRPYPRADDEDVIGLDAAFLALTVIEGAPPEHDPATHAPVMSEAIDQEAGTLTRSWTLESIVPSAKVWPNAEHFVAEFTLEEMTAIGLSGNATIAALRFMLSAWLSTVRADDARVIAGLDALEAEEIIDAARRAVICGLTTND